MVRTVKAKVLAEKLQRALGFTSGIPAGTEFGVRLGDALSRGIERVWTAAHWPQVRRFEKRIYRAPYGFVDSWEKGQECYADEEYWRAEKSGELGKPGEDEAWRKLEKDEVMRFVALDQPWENTAIGVGGIELNAFAYGRDPKVFPEQVALEPCGFAGDYPGGGTTRVMLPRNAPNAVWCAFIPDAPRLDFGTTWSAGSVYSRGDVVYHNGSCWMALLDDSTEEPSAGSTWEEQKVPEFMVDAVLLFAQGSFTSEDQGRARSEAEGQQRVDAMIETYFGGQAEWERATFSVKL